MSQQYTTMSLEAIKLLCSTINKTVDLPNTVISDTSIATNTTYSSFRLDKEFDTLEDELKHYTDTAIAGLNKLTKEIINDKSLVVKDNVLYLYKAADDPSNDYMQMMLINGVAVELGSTQADFSNIYDKSEVDSKFAAKLDLDALTASFNTLVDKVNAIEDEIGTETLTTTSTTIKGAINEVADKSEEALNKGKEAINKSEETLNAAKELLKYKDISSTCVFRTDAMGSNGNLPKVYKNYNSIIIVWNNVVIDAVSSAASFGHIKIPKNTNYDYIVSEGNVSVVRAGIPKGIVRFFVDSEFDNTYLYVSITGQMYVGTLETGADAIRGITTLYFNEK